MRLKSILRGSCAALFLFPAPLMAQEADTILVIGGRLPSPVEDLTSSASQIDAEDIELRGTDDLAASLRSVPGFAVSRSGPVGGLTELRVRGSEANHVLVLIDGIEASVPLTGGFDFAHASGFGVERVEVLHGEQSALWGSDAIGGVINIQTTGPSSKPHGSSQIEAGSFGALSAGFTASNDWVGASLSYTRREGVDASGNDGEEDGYERLSASTRGEHALSETESIQWAARFADFESEFDSDSDFNGLLNDNDRVSRGQQWALGGRFASQRDGFGQIVSVSRIRDQLESYADGAFSSESEAGRWQAFYQPSVQWDSGRQSHSLTGVLEYEAEDFTSFSGTGAGSNQSQQIENTALALDYRLSFEGWRVSASARQDWNGQFDDAATWRLGAAYLFEAVNGRIHASLGEGVKNPGVYELFGFFPGFFQGNPDLMPERSRGWEIGWDQQFSLGSLGLVWFEADLEDEIFTDFSGPVATARNQTSASNRSGLALSGAFDLTDQVTITGSASWLDSQENGTAELRRPDFIASLAVNWQSPDSRLRAGLAADHTGDQLDTDFGTFQRVILPAYTLVSGQLAWQATRQAEIYVRGTNLLDEETTDVFGYAAEGRGLFIGLRLGG